jgi:Zn-dependent protease
MAISDRDIDTAAADIPVTRDSREVLDRAAAASTARGLSSVDPVDVLRAMLEKPEGYVEETMRALGIDPAAVASSLAPDGAAPPLPLRQLLVNANREAQVLGHYRVDPIHLLLALLYSDSRSTSVPLQKAGVTLYDVRRHLQTGALRADPVAARPSTSRSPDRALRRRPLPKMRGVLGLSPIFLGIVAVVVASGAALWTQVLPYRDALTLVFIVAAWVMSVCLHEFAHAFVAYIGGDRSIATSGYLTLDPLRYTNVVMSIAVPVAALLLGGIGLPGGAVYINHAALRSKTWDSAVSLAGPIGTAVCGLVAAGIFALADRMNWITGGNLGFFEALSFVAYLEAFAVILNLLPIPPLDGYGIIRPWLPYSWQASLNRLGYAGLLIVFLLLWNVPPIIAAISNATASLAGLVGVDPTLSYLGYEHMRFRDPSLGG